MKKEKTKDIVRNNYAKIAQQGNSCCVPLSSCCGTNDLAHDVSRKIGYTEEELKEVPQGSNLGLGCGNPIALASLKKGETVLDLGSGAGFDCFLAADRVGRSGKVIGVDMTPEMTEKAKSNATKSDYLNVEFRTGEIENLPVADNSADAVISNCVINLSPEKQRVFYEVFRVLKPGGRMIVSDIVLTRELPDFLKDSADAYIACISGAVTRDEYLNAVKNAGFQEIEIIDESSFPVEGWINDPTIRSIAENLKISPEEINEITDSIVSIKIKGVKTIQTT
ncbi:MAG: arsenite methyltransferase [Candidatus Mariimomonas ferrooxydans]